MCKILNCVAVFDAVVSSLLDSNDQIVFNPSLDLLRLRAWVCRLKSLSWLSRMGVHSKVTGRLFLVGISLGLSNVCEASKALAFGQVGEVVIINQIINLLTKTGTLSL